MSVSTDIYILDAIGPFFAHAPETRINWSKIPFVYLEKDGRVQRGLFPEIRKHFDTVCQHAKAYGFTAISVDDLPHLVDHPEYPPDLRARIQSYREEFGTLFSIAQSYGLSIYVTTDIMFFNETIERVAGRHEKKWQAWMIRAIEDLFAGFPQVAGIISRIGESDGLDVHGDFLSRLTIRSPRQAQRWIKALLPVFERNRRRWIFRTWSVGAYRIGDLIWNRDTLRAIISVTQSPWFTLSLKHGESDFFRYLPISMHFFRGTQPRIIELQARREYEGAGEFPSFIGQEIERFRNELHQTRNLAGAMVWCQTGGWVRFRRLTFIDPAGLWNAINTWVAIRILKDGFSAREAVEAWRRRYAPQFDGDDFWQLLTLSSRAVADLFYIDEFARKKVYFRRLRIPPLLAVFWDHVIINHSMRQVLRCFVTDGERAVEAGYRALDSIAEMRRLAGRLSLPVRDFDLMLDTGRILALAREYYFRDFTEAHARRLEAECEKYQTTHAIRYSVHLDFRPVRIRTARLRWYLKILFRDKRGYRMIDRIFTLRLLSWIYPVLKKTAGRFMPSFSRDHAMGIDTVFR